MSIRHGCNMSVVFLGYMLVTLKCALWQTMKIQMKYRISSGSSLFAKTETIIRERYDFIWKLKIVSEYDQEIPQSQTADNPVAPRGRAAQPVIPQHSKFNVSNQKSESIIRGEATCMQQHICIHI